MADIGSYERKQKPGRYSGRDSGDIQDYNEVGGRKNFRGPKASKSGAGVSPKASGDPWKYGRASQAEADYGKDYSRKGSDYGKGATGPKRPSAAIPNDVTGPNNGDRKSQMDHK